MDKVFVAHEYTHALQDQHFDLEANRINDLTEGDAAWPSWRPSRATRR